MIAARAPGRPFRARYDLPALFAFLHRRGSGLNGGEPDVPTTLPHGCCTLGPYVLDTVAEALLREGAPLPVGRRAVALLLMLVRRAGAVVTKDELMAGVWVGLIVEESNLTSQVAALRRVFARDPASAAWIETLPRRGYRFTGPVAWAGPACETPPRPAAASTALNGRPVVGVLPFRVPDQAAMPIFLADGLVEDIVSALAGLPDLTVISRGSTLRYRDSVLDLAEIGRALGARYLVSGSVRRDGDRIRITVELAEAATGAVVSSRTHDGEWGAPFETQDRIVGQIVRALAPRVRDEELRRIRVKHPDSLVAYDFVMQARELIHRLDRDSFDRARNLLAQAMTIEPRYAAAHTMAAEWHSLRIGQGWSPDRAADALAVARYAGSAVEIDAGDANALARLGHMTTMLYRNYQAAIALFERALDASPNSAVAWMWSSATFAFAGDAEEAVDRAERALRLSPRDSFAFQFYHMLCLAHYTAGLYAEAVRWGLASLAENPRYGSNVGYTVAALVASGDLEQATVLARERLKLEPTLRVATIVARHPYRDVMRRVEHGRRLSAAGLPD